MIGKNEGELKRIKNKIKWINQFKNQPQTASFDGSGMDLPLSNDFNEAQSSK